MHSIVYARERASLLSSRVPFLGSDQGQRPYDRDLVATTRPCVSRKNTEAAAVVMQRDALISLATSSVLGLRAGMTPFLCAGSSSDARESVETIPFTIDLNLSHAMQLPRGLETALAETTAPLFSLL